MPRPLNLVKWAPLCASSVQDLPEGERNKKIKSMKSVLEERKDAGDHVPRGLWPRDKAYDGITNLYRYEIDREMRATYTIGRIDGKWVVTVIEVFWNHKSYERRFGY